MWYKKLDIEFRGNIEEVIVFLSDSTEDGQEEVTIQSMKNEFFLIQNIYFTDRDDAYMFIQCFTVEHATLFFEKQAIDNGALESID